MGVESAASQQFEVVSANVVFFVSTWGISQRLAILSTEQRPRGLLGH